MTLLPCSGSSRICQRRSTGNFTFGVFKGFTRPGSDKPERTSFIPEDLAEPYLRLVKLALERIEQIRQAGEAPFPERR